MNRNALHQEALSHILPHNRCGVNMCMGTGKTRLGLKVIAARKYKKILVVIPKKSVMSSWIEELKIYPEMSKLITFSTYRSLVKQDNSYDFIILDEFHSLTSKHIPFLQSYKGDILGLSGTPPNNMFDIKYTMMTTYCPIVFTYTIDQAVANMLNNYEIIVHKLSLSKVKNLKKKGKSTTWVSSEEHDYNYLTSKVNYNTGRKKSYFAILRMSAMKTYPSKERLAKKLMQSITEKCILFCNTQEQADRLCKHSYHSKNPDSKENLELFADGRLQKISAVEQLNEGVTIPNLKEGIIMHAYGNNKKSAQKIGRFLRLTKDQVAKVHILCYRDTIDEEWVKKALVNFDESKIKTIEHA